MAKIKKSAGNKGLSSIIRISLSRNRLTTERETPIEQKKFNIIMASAVKNHGGLRSKLAGNIDIFALVCVIKEFIALPHL